jgi:hypothetical protein
MYVSQKENLKVRLESRERWRKGLVRRNLGEAREMVRKAKELDGMVRWWWGGRKGEE